MNCLRLRLTSVWPLLRLPTCPADIMEDAEQQGLGDATGSPHGAVQLGQSPIELLRLFGPHHAAGLILLLCGHGIVTHTPHCIWPHTTGEVLDGDSRGGKRWMDETGQREQKQTVTDE